MTERPTRHGAKLDRNCSGDGITPFAGITKDFVPHRVHRGFLMTLKDLRPLRSLGTRLQSHAKPPKAAKVKCPRPKNGRLAQPATVGHADGKADNWATWITIGMADVDCASLHGSMFNPRFPAKSPDLQSRAHAASGLARSAIQEEAP
jgi:hypothetical protein